MERSVTVVDDRRIAVAVTGAREDPTSPGEDCADAVPALRAHGLLDGQFEVGSHVGEVGFEPTNPEGLRILSPPRLPFRHSPLMSWVQVNAYPR